MQNALDLPDLDVPPSLPHAEETGCLLRLLEEFIIVPLKGTAVRTGKPPARHINDFLLHDITWYDVWSSCGTRSMCRSRRNVLASEGSLH